MHSKTLHRLSWTLLATVATLSFASAQQRAPWSDERYNPKSQERNVAGEFDYYALVMSWSPTYCSNATERDAMQCSRSDGRRYGFVLHGLWPQYERGYPGDCRLPRRPFVPEPLISSMLDIMPSRGLVIHEYRKHGTCSGLDPQNYYAAARRLFNSVRIPEAYRNPFETLNASPRDLASQFARANPQLKPGSIAIACGGSGNRLKEIRICFTKDGASRECGDNENQRKLCSAEQVYIPPVRSTARDGGYGSTKPPSDTQLDGTSARRPLPGFRPLENRGGM
jgi:ribonuclease T2